MREFIIFLIVFVLFNFLLSRNYVFTSLLKRIYVVLCNFFLLAIISVFIFSSILLSYFYLEAVLTKPVGVMRKAKSKTIPKNFSKIKSSPKSFSLDSFLKKTDEIKDGFTKDIEVSGTKASRTFPTFRFKIDYPDNFDMINVTYKEENDVMGAMENGELKFLKFNNDSLSFILGSGYVTISFERYLYQPDYRPISPTGGGNIELNSIFCGFEGSDCKNDEFVLVNNEKGIYRQNARRTKDEYYYATTILINNQTNLLTTYIRFLQQKNEFDGLMVNVRFAPNSMLSETQKNKYLKVVDEIIASIKTV